METTVELTREELKTKRTYFAQLVYYNEYDSGVGSDRYLYNGWERAYERYSGDRHFVVDSNMSEMSIQLAIKSFYAKHYKKEYENPDYSVRIEETYINTSKDLPRCYYIDDESWSFNIVKIKDD